MVVNGDFENGASGFTSDYIPGTGGSWGLLSNPGQYAISTNPNLVHNNFYYCGDHTSGSGQMYIANGSDLANTIVWSQTIPVVQNTNYNFSAWVSSVENTGNPAILQFFVNNIQIGNVFSPTTTGCDWSQFYNLWNSGSNTSAVITIKNQNIDGGGNDFAMDDITFTSYCTNSDSIVVQFDTTTISAGSDLTFCSTVPEYLVGTSNDPATTFSWSTAETTDSILPASSGVYTLTGTTINGCIVTDAATVTVNLTPVASFSASPASGIVPLPVTFTNTSQNGVSFEWDFDNGLTSNTTDLSNVSTIYTSPGQYNATLIASTPTCSDTISALIDVTNPISLEETNVFTPNNDGSNDVYQFKMMNIVEIDLSISNRWGNLMFETTDVNATWDGKDKKGNEASDGVYFYKYTAKSIEATSFEGQGFIHLVR